VSVTPDAGVASFGEVQSRILNRYPHRADPLPQTLASAHRRARSQLRKHAVAAQLRVCVTLTYETEPSNPVGDVDEFIANASHHYPEKFHWAVVTVLSEDCVHRTHHHVLIPRNLEIDKIASSWGKGMVHIGFNPTDGDIRRMVNYVAQDFPKRPSSRPRYRRSRGSVCRPIRFGAPTLEEAERLASSFASSQGNTRSAINSPHGARGVIYWDVERERDL